jgi:hypothetical protein
VEQWLDLEAMNSHLSSEQFRGVIGAIKVLGKLTDIDLSEATLIEGMSPRRDPFESCGAKKRTYEKSTS